MRTSTTMMMLCSILAHGCVGCLDDPLPVEPMPLPTPLPTPFPPDVGPFPFDAGPDAGAGFGEDAGEVFDAGGEVRDVGPPLLLRDAGPGDFLDGGPDGGSIFGDPGCVGRLNRDLGFDRDPGELSRITDVSPDAITLSTEAGATVVFRWAGANLTTAFANGESVRASRDGGLDRLRGTDFEAVVATLPLASDATTARFEDLTITFRDALCGAEVPGSGCAWETPGFQIGATAIGYNTPTTLGGKSYTVHRVRLARPADCAGSDFVVTQLAVVP